MRAPGRSILVALVPSGTIAGHVLGYLWAGGDASLSGPHSHLRPATWLGAALAAMALALLATVGAERGRRRIRLPGLAAAQCCSSASSRPPSTPTPGRAP